MFLSAAAEKKFGRTRWIWGVKFKVSLGESKLNYKEALGNVKTRKPPLKCRAKKYFVGTVNDQYFFLWIFSEPTVNNRLGIVTGSHVYFFDFGIVDLRIKP